MDKISDLYDLFGETAYCSICLEDISEGSRVRALNICNHIFHSMCIDKWFLEKSCCPSCRTEYNIVKDTSITDINNIDRLFMTWTLIHGVLKKIKNATSFNDKKNEIRILFYNFRSLPVYLDSRYSLSTIKKHIANRISRALNIRINTIYRQPQVYNWIDKIENHIDYTRSIQQLWRI